MPKKPGKPKQSPDAARRIWLAGIGAYGRAFNEAQESIARMSGETGKLFDELVKKGEEIEDAVEAKGRELARSVAPAGFEERISKMRERLGMNSEDMAIDETGADSGAEDRLQALEAMMGDIMRRLDGLEASIRKQESAAPATKKTAARATPSKRKTTAARKTPTKKKKSAS